MLEYVDETDSENEDDPPALTDDTPLTTPDGLALYSERRARALNSALETLGVPFYRVTPDMLRTRQGVRTVLLRLREEHRRALADDMPAADAYADDDTSLELPDNLDESTPDRPARFIADAIMDIADGINDKEDKYKHCSIDDNTYLDLCNLSREIWQYSRDNVAGQLAETNERLMDSEAEAKRKMQTLMRHNTEFMADCKRLREALERELKDKLAVREARDRFKSKWEATEVELKHEMAHSAKVLKKTEAECEAKVKQVQTKCAERLSQIKQMKQEHEHALAQKDLQIQQNKDALVCRGGLAPTACTSFARGSASARLTRRKRSE